MRTKKIYDAIRAGSLVVMIDGKKHYVSGKNVKTFNRNDIYPIPHGIKEHKSFEIVCLCGHRVKENAIWQAEESFNEHLKKTRYK